MLSSLSLSLFHSSPRNCLPARPSSSRLHHLSYILFPYYCPSFSIRWSRISDACAMLTRDTNNAHFGILHGRCNERSYRGYNAVTSAHVATATMVDQICGSLFTVSVLFSCTNATVYCLQAIFRLLANNPKTRWSRHNEIPYIIVNYMREYRISWFYHEHFILQRVLHTPHHF